MPAPKFDPETATTVEEAEKQLATLKKYAGSNDYNDDEDSGVLDDIGKAALHLESLKTGAKGKDGGKKAKGEKPAEELGAPKEVILKEWGRASRSFLTNEKGEFLIRSAKEDNEKAQAEVMAEAQKYPNGIIPTDKAGEAMDAVAKRVRKWIDEGRGAGKSDDSPAGDNNPEPNANAGAPNIDPNSGKNKNELDAVMDVGDNGMNLVIPKENENSHLQVWNPKADPDAQRRAMEHIAELWLADPGAQKYEEAALAKLNR